MPDQQSNLPPIFDGEVRLFPLSNLVMFPNNLLPLHIFESRYREMLEDAVQADQLITMATLVPGFEHDYYSRPPIAPVVCIGRVTAHEKTEQGTYNLMLLVFMVLFVAPFHWIAFGPGERSFSSSTSMGGVNLTQRGGETSGRLAFGLGAILMDIFSVFILYRIVRGKDLSKGQ